MIYTQSENTHREDIHIYGGATAGVQASASRKAGVKADLDNSKYKYHTPFLKFRLCSYWSKIMLDLYSSNNKPTQQGIWAHRLMSVLN